MPKAPAFPFAPDEIADALPSPASAKRVAELRLRAASLLRVADMQIWTRGRRALARSQARTLGLDRCGDPPRWGAAGAAPVATG
jgi:hypothetical protein